LDQPAIDIGLGEAGRGHPIVEDDAVRRLIDDRVGQLVGGVVGIE
jgi:hypothetical protein